MNQIMADSFRWYLWFLEIVESPADLNYPTIIKPEETKLT